MFAALRRCLKDARELLISLSYWEWFRINAASLLISSAITGGGGFVIWRLMHQGMRYRPLGQ